MSTNIRKAYSEIYEILQLLGSEFIDKIPNKFIEFIEREKDNNYNVNIRLDIPLEEQNLLEDTVNILAMLKLDYWCESDEEKEELKRILDTNEQIYQEDLRKKYNPDNIFKNKIEEQKLQEKNSLIVIKEEKWYRKILNIIKNLLKKN